MGVEELKEAVKRLPKEDLARFRSWFLEFDAALWDEEFAEDARGGKLDSLAEEALRDLREGRCADL